MSGGTSRVSPEYTNNPQTGRPILVGGATWRKLLKTGQTESTGAVQQPARVKKQPLFVVADAQAAKAKAAELRERVSRGESVPELPPGTVPRAVSVRGQPAKVVAQRKRVTTADASSAAVNAAVRVILALKQDASLLSGVSETELPSLLRRLIAEDAVSPGIAAARTRRAVPTLPPITEEADEDASELSDEEAPPPAARGRSGRFVAAGQRPQ